jgi:hypothetical protein
MDLHPSIVGLVHCEDLSWKRSIIYLFYFAITDLDGDRNRVRVSSCTDHSSDPLSCVRVSGPTARTIVSPALPMATTESIM